MSRFTVVDRTDSYTPAFRAGEGFQELWSVDFDDKTVGVIRRHGNRWSPRAYDGKKPNGLARHRLLGETDSKAAAAQLIQDFYQARYNANIGDQPHMHLPK